MIRSLTLHCVNVYMITMHKLACSQELLLGVLFFCTKCGAFQIIVDFLNKIVDLFSKIVDLLF